MAAASGPGGIVNAPGFSGMAGGPLSDVWHHMSALQYGGGVGMNTNQAFTESVRQFFDSTAKDDRVVFNPSDNVTHTARTMMQIMGNRSMKLAFIIADRIVDPFRGWINQVIPTLYTDKANIDVMVEEDLMHVADPLPHYGVVRVGQTIGYNLHKELSQVGFGLDMELTRFMNPGGMDMYMRRVLQISNAVERRIYIATIEALLSSNLLREKRLRMAPSHFSIGTIQRQQVKNFCATCFGDGPTQLQNMFNAAYTHISNFAGVQPNAIIIGPKTQTRLDRGADRSPVVFIGVSMDPEQVGFMEYQSRQSVQRAFPENVAVYVDRGLTLNPAAPPYELLVNNATIAEFGISGPYNVLSQLSCDEEAKFCTDKCNISLSDMQRRNGGFVRIKYTDSLAMTFFWGDPAQFKDPTSPHGRLGWQKHDRPEAMHDDDDDDYSGMDPLQAARQAYRQYYGVRYEEYRGRSRAVRTSPKLSFLQYEDGHLTQWVRVLGQISTDHWDHKTFRSYAEAGLRAAMKDDDFKRKLNNGLLAYVEFCRTLESQVISGVELYNFIAALIEKNRGNTEVRNGIPILKPNAWGSLDLPDAAMDFIPPCYASPSGCLYMAARGDQYPGIQALAKRAREGIEAAYEIVNEFLPSSRAVQADLAPSIYEDTGKGVHTLAMTLTAMRPAMWIRMGTGPSSVGTSSLGTQFFPMATVDGKFDGKIRADGVLEMNKYTISVGGARSIEFENVPLITLERVANIKVTNYARSLAMMGGQTLKTIGTLYSRMFAIESAEPFSELVVLVGRQDGGSSSFSRARAMVAGLNKGDLEQIKNYIEKLFVLVEAQPTVFSDAAQKRSYLSKRKKKTEEAEKILSQFEKDYDKSADHNHDNPMWMQLYSPDAIKFADSDQGQRMAAAAQKAISDGSARLEFPTVPEWMRSQPGATHLGASTSISPVTSDGARRFGRTPLVFTPNMILPALTNPDIVVVPSEPDQNDNQPLDATGRYARDTNTLAARPEFRPVGQQSGGLQSNISLTDLPGVRFQELSKRGNFRAFGQSGNIHFLDRLDNAISREGNTLLRMWMTAYALSSIEEWTEVERLTSKNQPLPIHCAVTNIRLVQQTETAILLATGPETGANWLASPMYTTHVDGTIAKMGGRFQVMHGCLIHGQNRVQVMYHIAPAAIEGGAGTKFYPFPSYYGKPGTESNSSKILRMRGYARPDLVVFGVSPSEAASKPTEFDLIGRTAKERMNNLNPRIEGGQGPGYNQDGTLQSYFKLSSADFHESVWNFRALMHASRTFGTYAFQTTYGVWSEKDKKLVPTEMSTGPRKSGYGHGAAEVWDGSRPTFGLFDVRKNSIPA